MHSPPSVQPWTPFETATFDNWDVPESEKINAYVNSRYTVWLRKYKQKPEFIDLFGDTIIHLSIKRNDKLVIHDWRDMQRIKDELIGTEFEGYEICPAQSNMVDTANQYHLWIPVRTSDTGVITPVRLPFGWSQGRMVSEVEIDNKQRAWDAENRPTDLLSREEMEKVRQRFKDRKDDSA